MSNLTYRPKGGMCANCKYLPAKLAEDKCPKPVDFPWMKRIGIDKDGVVVVKCENFKSVDKG